METLSQVNVMYSDSPPLGRILAGEGSEFWMLWSTPSMPQLLAAMIHLHRTLETREIISHVCQEQEGDWAWPGWHRARSPWGFESIVTATAMKQGEQCQLRHTVWKTGPYALGCAVNGMPSDR
ncbi:hypothetical protein JZ751_020868, partial [Albula glossodonta]